MARFKSDKRKACRRFRKLVNFHSATSAFKHLRMSQLRDRMAVQRLVVLLNVPPVGFLLHFFATRNLGNTRSAVRDKVNCSNPLYNFTMCNNLGVHVGKSIWRFETWSALVLSLCKCSRYNFVRFHVQFRDFHAAFPRSLSIPFVAKSTELINGTKRHAALLCQLRASISRNACFRAHWYYISMTSS